MKYFTRFASPGRISAGFTVIEVLTAITIFSTAALCLAATSAFIVRQTAMNAKREYGASLASARSELLHARPCSAAASGTAATGGLRSQWTVQRNAASVEQVHEIVRATPSGDRATRHLSGTPCE